MTQLDTRSRASNPSSAAACFSLMSTCTYLGRCVRHPRQTWADLLADPARLRHGFTAVLVVGMGYALTVAGIALSNGRPSAPWLAIPESQYFIWEALFIAPVTLLCWILAAGVTHLICKVLHGSGNLDDTLALLGFAVAVPTLITLIPDAIRTTLTAAGWLNRAAWEACRLSAGHIGLSLSVDRYVLAYIAGLLWLFPLAVGTAQGLLVGGRWSLASPVRCSIRAHITVECRMRETTPNSQPELAKHRLRPGMIGRCR